MTEILEKLFESDPKVRILRICMRNSDDSFTREDLAKRSQLRPRVVSQELEKLVRIGVIERGTARITEEKIQKKRYGKKYKIKIITKSRKATIYFANKNLEIFPELQNLISKASVTSKREIANKIKSLGSIKLALVSGIFINNPNSRTDLLIVGDKVSTKKVNAFLSKIEADLGKSIHYTLMDTSEFKYRISMYDRFLRDILEFPHEKLINKVNI